MSLIANRSCENQFRDLLDFFQFQPMALLTVVGLGSGALFAQAIAQVISAVPLVILSCFSCGLFHFLVTREKLRY